MDRTMGRDRDRGTVVNRLAAALMAAILVLGLLPATARAATATTTTLEVASDSIEIPSGEVSGTLLVTAHVVPAPQSFNGFIPGVGFLVDGNAEWRSAARRQRRRIDRRAPVGSARIRSSPHSVASGDFEGSERVTRRPSSPQFADDRRAELQSEPGPEHAVR